MPDTRDAPAAGSSVESPLDIAVVGGGVGGLYAAWRLLDAGSDAYRSAAVFEMSHRIGGRLLTVIPPDAPSLRAELGGMRFLDSQHLVVHVVKSVLGLPCSPAPVGEPQNMAYLRDHLLRVKDLDAKPYVLPYDVAKNEQVSMGALMDTVISKVVTRVVGDSRELRECLAEQGFHYEPGQAIDAATLTRAQWHCVQTWGRWEGYLLRDWGFWNLLYRVMSPEAYSMVADCSGYDTIVSNWNAADAMPWFLADFGDVTYLRPDNGMESIPLGLAELASGLGCSIHLDRELVGLESSGDLVRLSFSSQGGESPSPVFARRVVLAMPRRSLERIGAGLDAVLGAPGVANLVEAVTPTPLFKLFNLYDSPWWEELGGDDGAKITEGRSVTTIPVRQVYYFGTEPTTKRSLLMMYNDDRAIKYWIGFLRDPSLGSMRSGLSFSGEQQPYMGGQWDEYRAPDMMRKEAHRLLELMHGVDNIPEPLDAVFRDWSADPYGGAYNMWKIHADSFAVSRDIVHPVESLPVYVCGEAYSHDQGWVEGALGTAEDMLVRFFSLPPLVPTT